MIIEDPSDIYLMSSISSVIDYFFSFFNLINIHQVYRRRKKKTRINKYSFSIIILSLFVMTFFLSHPHRFVDYIAHMIFSFILKLLPSIQIHIITFHNLSWTCIVQSNTCEQSSIYPNVQYFYK